MIILAIVLLIDKADEINDHTHTHTHIYIVTILEEARASLFNFRNEQEMSISAIDASTVDL